MKKIILTMVLVFALTFSAALAEIEPYNWQDKVAVGDPVDWRSILQYYRDDDDTNQLIFVKYTSGTDAEIQVYFKDREENNAWTKVLTCDGKVGRNGAGLTHEGGGRTPLGIYKPITAFGIKKNPGTALDYVDVTPTVFACDELDSVYYNTIIDLDALDEKHECKGEEMYKYSPEYNYGFFMDYNAERTPGKGSAIFFHCDGARDYTGGCVAVSEENMKWILQNCDNTLKVCIFNK